jgi:hypothetical protein
MHFNFKMETLKLVFEPAGRQAWPLTRYIDAKMKSMNALIAHILIIENAGSAAARKTPLA